MGCTSSKDKQKEYIHDYLQNFIACVYAKSGKIVYQSPQALQLFGELSTIPICFVSDVNTIRFEEKLYSIVKTTRGKHTVLIFSKKSEAIFTYLVKQLRTCILITEFRHYIPILSELILKADNLIDPNFKVKIESVFADDLEYKLKSRHIFVRQDYFYLSVIIYHLLYMGFEQVDILNSGDSLQILFRETSVSDSIVIPNDVTPATSEYEAGLWLINRCVNILGGSFAISTSGENLTISVIIKPLSRKIYRCSKLNVNVCVCYLTNKTEKTKLAHFLFHLTNGKITITSQPSTLVEKMLRTDAMFVESEANSDGLMKQLRELGYSGSIVLLVSDEKECVSPSEGFDESLPPDFDVMDVAKILCSPKS